MCVLAIQFLSNQGHPMTFPRQHVISFLLFFSSPFLELLAMLLSQTSLRSQQNHFFLLVYIVKILFALLRIDFHDYNQSLLMMDVCSRTIDFL